MSDRSHRLSRPQWQMLRAVARTGNAFSHLYGASAHGGGDATFYSLVRRGLITASGLTEQGRQRLLESGDLPAPAKATP